MRRILIVDDHVVVRDGVKKIFDEKPDEAVFGEASTVDEALQLIRERIWDVVVLDISLGQRSGLDVLQELKQLRPKLPVLIFSMHAEEQYARRAFRAGAAGYITKGSSRAELVIAINKVISGDRYVSPALAEKLVFDMARGADGPLHETLSQREFEVMRLLASGKTISEIAELLSLSDRTVSTYRVRLLEKMGMKTTVELTHYAVKNGFSRVSARLIVTLRVRTLINRAQNGSRDAFSGGFSLLRWLSPELKLQAEACHRVLGRGKTNKSISLSLTSQSALAIMKWSFATTAEIRVVLNEFNDLAAYFHSSLILILYPWPVYFLQGTMPIRNQSRLALTNHLLTALPPREYRRLAPYLEPVSLDVNQVLNQPNEPLDQVYFPDDAVIPIVSRTKDGRTVEVGMVGNEGVMGFHALLEPPQSLIST